MSDSIDNSHNAEILHRAIDSAREFVSQLAANNDVDTIAVDVLVDMLLEIWNIQSIKVRISIAQDTLREFQLL